MAVCHELIGRTVSVTSKNPRGSRKFIVLDAEDGQDAYDATFAEADFDFEGMPLLGIDLEERGANIWYATAQYGIEQAAASSDPQTGTGHDPVDIPSRPATTDPLGPEYSFQTGGGTTKIYQSIATIDSLKAGGGSVPDTHGAIGAHGDSDQIDGVDIVTPKLEWTKTIKVGEVNLKYLRKLAQYTGTVNSADFYGFEAGEVLFLGCNGQYKLSANELPWTLTFTFAISPNVSSLEVSDEITFTGGKKGWEYVWASYAKNVSNNALARKVMYAYIEQVYETKDFKNLGI